MGGVSTGKHDYGIITHFTLTFEKLPWIYTVDARDTFQRMYLQIKNYYLHLAGYHPETSHSGGGFDKNWTVHNT